MADSAPKAEKVEPPPPLKATHKSKVEDPTKPKRGRGRPPGSGSNLTKLETSLAEFIGAFALIFAIRGDMHCANIITQGAPHIAKSYTELAKVNPGVRKVLEQVTQGSAWGGVILSTTSVVFPIAQHHSERLQKLPNPFDLGGMMAQAATQAPPQETRVPVGDWSP